MTDRPSDGARFPEWLRDTRQNFVTTGAVLLALGETVPEEAAVTWSFRGLALVCLVASVLDGPHLREKAQPCRWLWEG